jgi:hypothetical protein
MHPILSRHLTQRLRRILLRTWGRNLTPPAQRQIWILWIFRIS